MRAAGGRSSASSRSPSSICASLVPWPSENRRLACAVSFGTPIAMRTCDGAANRPCSGTAGDADPFQIEVDEERLAIHPGKETLSVLAS